jgi:hypothetical protein
MIALYIALGIVAVLLIVAFCWFNNKAISTTHYTVNLATLKQNNLTIVHLSDLHGKTFGKNNNRLLAIVQSQQPDVICYTGDAIHKYRKRDFKVALEFFQKATKVAPVLFVSGNHEMRNKKWRIFRNELQQIGVTVLENEVAEVGKIPFAGLNAACLKNATLSNLQVEGEPKILLAHDPRHFENYVQKGFDVILCGHAHGGQFRIPFTKRGVFAPGQGLLPTYCMGEYRKGKSVMIVSRGLGNSEFPLRLFNRPEVVVVHLTK